MKYLIPLILLATGCASGEFDNRRSNAASSFDRAIDAATERAQSEMVASNCQDFKIPNKVIKGHFFTAKKCGTISDQLISKGELKAEVCPALNLKGNACDKQVLETFTARLEDRYSASAINAADKKCKMFPTKCKTMTEFELIALSIHNDNVQAQYMDAIERVGQGYAQRVRAISIEEGEENSRFVSGALGSMANAFQSSTVATHPSYRPQQCVGIAPLAPYGCHMVCINGSWSSVCN